jgi:hypothetical protein
MTKGNKTTHEEFYLDDIELRPEKFFFIEGMVTYEFEDCECTSECGSETVTERWVQRHIINVEVDRLGYYVDSDIGTIRMPIDALSEEDHEIIKFHLTEYEP